MVSRSDDVLVQVDGGRELMSYPGLNIIGGVQPRASSAVMPPNMLDTLDPVDMGGMVDPEDNDDEEAMFTIRVFVVAAMLEPVIACLFAIPDVGIAESVVVGLTLVEVSSPNAGPAWRMYSGRH